MNVRLQYRLTDKRKPIRAFTMTSTEMVKRSDRLGWHILNPRTNTTFCTTTEVRDYERRWVADAERATVTVCPQCLDREPTR